MFLQGKLIVSSPSLMIGLNLREFTVRLLLSAIFANADRSSRPPAFALDPFPDPLAALRMEHDTGGKVITADLWSFIPRLMTAVEGEAESETLYA